MTGKLNTIITSKGVGLKLTIPCKSPLLLPSAPPSSALCRWASSPLLLPRLEPHQIHYSRDSSRHPHRDCSRIEDSHGPSSCTAGPREVDRQTKGDLPLVAGQVRKCELMTQLSDLGEGDGEDRCKKSGDQWSFLRKYPKQWHLQSAIKLVCCHYAIKGSEVDGAPTRKIRLQERCMTAKKEEFSGQDRSRQMD